MMSNTLSSSSGPLYLEGLNPQQRQAVLELEGPLLILSGAGTGKTKVLTTRIAHILATHHAYANQILAVTFTNRAAQEMRDRILQLVGSMASGLWLGTFHSLGAKILRAHGEHIGFTPQFTILDADDQLRLIKQLIASEGLNDKELPARAALTVIQRWKDRGLTPEHVSLSNDVHGGLVLTKLYEAYQSQLKRLNAMDFGDLLLHTLTLFKKVPEVLTRYHHQFRHILVDEYQDTNVAQYLWLRMLTQGGGHLCCVGDDDQSIYGWRGAEVGNILRFEEDFPTTKIIRLEQNYRSTTHILNAASSLIAQNKGRLGKTLWTEQTEGERVKVCGLWSGDEEARFVVDEIEARQRQGVLLRNMAILVRAGYQTREFEDRLLYVGVPYRIIGGSRFYERQEIRDILAYLRLTSHEGDDLAFGRIINVPKRGIGPSTVQRLHQLGREEEISLLEAARRLIETDELKPMTRSRLRSFIQLIEQWQKSRDTLSVAELATQVLGQSGYLDMWKADPSPDAPGRIENLKEFVTALEGFDSLTGFLEHVSLVMENNTHVGEDMVSLMTLHSAKGLEFQVVFLCGWEEGIFPHPRTIEELGMAGLEEERRLAYVGLTRARQEAIITFANCRRVHNFWQNNPPSRFLNDLSAHDTEDVSQGSSRGGR